MALETGIDKKQIEAIKAWVERLSSEPVQLRFVVSLIFFLVGWLGVNRPMAARLQEARERNKSAKALAQQAEEVAFYKTQRGQYEVQADVPADPVGWQKYVLSKLAYTSVTLISIEPKKTKGASVFKIIEMELVARGTHFDEMVDFIDRIEHGERLMRVERVRIERMQDTISMTCTLKGLVKPGAAAREANADARRGEGDGSEDATAEAAASAGEDGEQTVTAGDDAGPVDAGEAPGVGDEVEPDQAEVETGTESEAVAGDGAGSAVDADVEAPDEPGAEVGEDRPAPAADGDASSTPRPAADESTAADGVGERGDAMSSNDDARPASFDVAVSVSNDAVAAPGVAES